jgi:hypothetical protein
VSYKNKGNQGIQVPCLIGHQGPVLDFEFHPFQDDLVCTGGADGKVLVWQLSPDGITESQTTPLAKFHNHSNKVSVLRFHPSAENVLASGSFDSSVNIWDLQSATHQIQCKTDHHAVIEDLIWNYDGSNLLTSCKDKFVRLLDPRLGGVVASVEPFDGRKPTKLAWLGNTSTFCTVGFSRHSKRQFCFWDIKKMASPFSEICSIDQAAGVITPFYDEDLKILYFAGRGDGEIRFYEVVREEPWQFSISSFRTTDPQRDVYMLPKRVVNAPITEVAIFLKLTTSSVQPIRFLIPRKSELFQADLFPDCRAPRPACTAEQFFVGKTNYPPTLMSLDPKKREDIPLFQSFDVIAETLSLVTLVNSPVAQVQKGLESLINLASGKENKVLLMKTPGLVSALLTTIKTNRTMQARNLALTCLLNLSNNEENANEMMESYPVPEALEQFGKNQEVLTIYLNLSLAPRARLLLAKNEMTTALLKEAMSSPEQSICVTATMALAVLFGSDEERSEFLRVENSGTLNLIVEVLQSTVVAESSQVCFGIRWALKHSLYPLRYLLTVDENRRAFNSEKLVSLLLKALDCAFSLKDTQATDAAISCLLQYSLENQASLQMKGEELHAKLREVCKLEQVPEWAQAATTAGALLFKLDGKDLINTSSSSRSGDETLAHAQNLVMISYCWGPPPFVNKAIAQIVESWLKHQGFKVWRDETCMQSNIFDAMAQAVMASSAVVVLVTKTYYESPTCKLELQFANLHKKKIIPLLVDPGYQFAKDGWLGLLIGALLYFDISNPKLLNQSLSDMARKELGWSATVVSPDVELAIPQIQRLGQEEERIGSETNITAQIVSHPRSESTSSMQSSASTRSTVPASVDQIRQWLAEVVELDSEAADSLIQEGFVTEKHLRNLSKASPTDIKAMLNLKNSALALNLKLSLQELFQQNG